MSPNQIPSGPQVAQKLQSSLDVIWRISDKDECGSKHINHCLAAIVCGKTWRDGVDYKSPVCRTLEDWPWPGAGTVREELYLDNWSDDPTFRANVESQLKDPLYVIAGREQIARWQTRLTNQWRKIEALCSLAGRDEFLKAALSLPISEGALPSYLDTYWSNELLPREKQIIAAERSKHHRL